MNNQNMERQSPATTQERGGATKDIEATTSAAVSAASDVAYQVAGTAKQAASKAAARVTDQVKEVLDRQVDSGADVMGKLATSTKRVADDLEESAPLVAGMVRTFAQRMDGYAGDLRGQSVDQLLRAASDLTMRQPVLVFGLAALAGFLTCRTLKNAPVATSASGETFQTRGRQGASEFHGA
jgi:hypothetical protein